jgi:signal transduction histidine kinase
MTRLLGGSVARSARLPTLAPASRTGSRRRSATPRATTLRTLGESASAGRHDAVEVRYVATSGVPAVLSDDAHLIEELHATRLRIIQAAERERRRLERDLHDGAQQRLVEIQVRLATARALVDDAKLAKQLEMIQQAADAAIDELRALARGIYPATLRDLGPAAALRALAQRCVVPVHVTEDGLARSSDAIEAAIYFCAREAIQNTTKHAGPGARVRITLRNRRGMIELTISDNGVGMSPENASNGIGILGMQDRIKAVGGQFKIVSHRGLGTCIHATIPDQEVADSNTSTTSRSKLDHVVTKYAKPCDFAD